MAKKFYWLKLKEDFFGRREIKKLRKIAGGDTFVIIYLKMQLLSIRNDGKIEFEGTEESMLDQLELELDEDKENVALTIAFLTNNNLLEIIDNDYLLPKACESIGKESDSAERVRKHREKKVLQCNTKALPSNKCNVTSNTEIEIEIEKEKELDLNKERNIKKDYTPYEEIIDLFSTYCKELPQIKLFTDTRKKRVKKIYLEEAEQNIIFFKELFEKVGKSKFLNGENDNGWTATFDWILKPANMAKILEDNYKNTGGNNNESRGTDNTNTEENSITDGVEKDGIIYHSYGGVTL